MVLAEVVWVRHTLSDLQHVSSLMKLIVTIAVTLAVYCTYWAGVLKPVKCHTASPLSLLTGHPKCIRVLAVRRKNMAAHPKAILTHGHTEQKLKMKQLGGQDWINAEEITEISQSEYALQQCADWSIQSGYF